MEADSQRSSSSSEWVFSGNLCSISSAILKTRNASRLVGLLTSAAFGRRSSPCFSTSAVDSNNQASDARRYPKSSSTAPQSGDWIGKVERLCFVTATSAYHLLTPGPTAHLLGLPVVSLRRLKHPRLFPTTTAHPAPNSQHSHRDARQHVSNCAYRLSLTFLFLPAALLHHSLDTHRARHVFTAPCVLSEGQDALSTRNRSIDRRRKAYCYC